MQPYERILVLRGHAPIRDFVRFVRLRAIDGQSTSEFALTREWQQANASLQELQSTENNVAETVELGPLPAHLTASADEALQDAATRKSLAFLPHRWAMIELDRLIVWQKHVNLEFSDTIRKSLPSRPSIDDLLGVATGAKREAPKLNITPLGANSFAFSSPSTDIRVLEAVPLDPAKVAGYEPYGRAAAVVAVYIGYSINVMWVIHMGNRLMLLNGTHRAYALRAHGVTHVPCVVSRVSTRDELDLIGLPEHGESSSSYFERPRPPLLKDYFDERLCKTILVPPSHHVIQLDLKFERSRFPTHAP